MKIYSKHFDRCETNLSKNTGINRWNGSATLESQRSRLGTGTGVGRIFKLISVVTAMILTTLFLLTLAGCGSSGTAGNGKPDSNSTTAGTISSTSGDNTTQTGSQPRVPSYPFTYKEQSGKSVIIKTEPKKVVSLTPAVTEIVYALGKGGLLVGRTDYDDFPAEVKNVQSVGDTMGPSVEQIIQLSPDVVFASSLLKKDLEKKMEEVGITVVTISEGKDMNEVYRTITSVGQILNAEGKSIEIVDSMKKRLEGVSNKVEGQKAPKVYYVVDFGKSGDFTATGDTFISGLLDLAGGANIAKDASGWMYSLEKIIEKDPEIILVSSLPDIKKSFITTEGYSKLSAVTGNKVFEVDDNLLSRQGPRLVDGVEVLAKIFYPDLFK